MLRTCRPCARCLPMNKPSVSWVPSFGVKSFGIWKICMLLLAPVPACAVVLRKGVLSGSLNSFAVRSGLRGPLLFASSQAALKLFAGCLKPQAFPSRAESIPDVVWPGRSAGFDMQRYLCQWVLVPVYVCVHHPALKRSFALSLSGKSADDYLILAMGLYLHIVPCSYALQAASSGRR